MFMDAKDHLDGLDVFSCDVFDTVLLRRCTTPAGVFERTFDMAPIPAPFRDLRAAFVQHRQMAEARARESALAEDGSAETGIEAIYRHFPVHVFGLAPGDRPRLVEAEFQAETELCFANPPLVELYRAMGAAGLRRGFVSDTYWDSARLGALLRATAPDLGWDFLYASCEHGRSKSAGLFDTLLRAERVAPDRLLHIGDNPGADVRAPARLGIRTRHLPQSSPALASIFERESTMFGLLRERVDLPRHLDSGMRSARRVIAAAAPRPSPAFSYGVQVLGPVLTAFDRFVAERVDAIRAAAGTVAVAFLGRDGLLPHRLWRENGDTDGHYVEINRRIALLAGARTAEDLGRFFRDVPQVDLRAARNFLKMENAALRRYFAQAPGGIVPGKTFAAALPDLLSDAEIRDLGAAMRRTLLAHLRARIPGFDQCGDLVLVDLGYAGTVQRRLRAAFDAEGVTLRLHGLYLISEDAAFADLSESDSAEGFLSDAVLIPHAKRAVLKNISLIEQLCGAPQGSVMAYDDAGEPIREPDPRPPAQHDLVAEIQAGALHFLRGYRTAGASLPDCFERPRQTAHWAAAILARALLLPTDDELVLLGGIRQDMNLGSQALAPLLDAGHARALLLSRALPTAITTAQPPMWPAAGMAAQSPLHGLHYALFGTGHLPLDVAGEVPCGTLDAIVSDRSGAQTVSVTCLRTGDGALRLRVPLPARAHPTAVIVPAAGLPPCGLIQGVALQQGGTTAEAMATTEVELRLNDHVRGAGIAIAGDVYMVEAEDGGLEFPLPALSRAVAVLTVTILPLTGARVLALGD